ncbi:MAG: hypothetical protein QNI97_05140 [Desulfobacterales bacterium]|nr:hypothetical protein [Desulfobacterales bacterium]
MRAIDHAMAFTGCGRPRFLARARSWYLTPMAAGYSLFAILLLLGLSACAGLRVPPEPQYDSEATRELMTALYGANTDLTAAQWIGKASMTVEGRRRVFDRAVWAGAQPGRVRFDARTPFGLPVLSLACDEAYLTAILHSQGEYYRKHVGANGLGRIFPVNISCRDLYDLMVGRPPGIEYHSAQVETTTEGAYTIRLRRRFKGTVARLQVDAQSGRLTGVERLNVHGNRHYQVWLAEHRTVDGFSLPRRLELEGADGQLVLEAVRLYPNRPVTASLFRIPPPNDPRRME